MSARFTMRTSWSLDKPSGESARFKLSIGLVGKLNSQSLTFKSQIKYSPHQINHNPFHPAAQFLQAQMQAMKDY